MNKIPSQIVDFRAYNKNERLFGAGNEITLPDIESLTSELDLPAGKIDMPSMRTENMELEVPFTLFDKEAASVISFKNVSTIILRGSAQKVKDTTHDFEYGGIKVTAKGYAKKIALGTLRRSDKMDSSVTLTLSYLKVEDGDGNVFIEIDKINGGFEVNGENVREGIDKYL